VGKESEKLVSGLIPITSKYLQKKPCAGGLGEALRPPPEMRVRRGIEGKTPQSGFFNEK
jgi:hypothetical protein